MSPNPTRLLRAATARAHHSLQTFLATLPSPLPPIAALSTTHRGTLYEYICLNSLSMHIPGLALQRVGGAHDGGFDLVGTLVSPGAGAGEGEGQGRRVQVGVQCKNHVRPGKVGVRDVRELEGAFGGWDVEGTVGLICVPYKPGLGLRRAVESTRLQMGVVTVRRYEEGGGVVGILWNRRAAMGIGKLIGGEGDELD